ncbi:MAG: DoxX family protein [Nocardioides sp.]|uniref:DoxX family protein n=1 Tax=Nocardioides sp. TaxID=35761 RepID=UPI003EFD657F
MNIALWVVAGLLAVAFLGAGSMKALKSKEQLKEGGMHWVDSFSAPVVKAIGVAEVLGALGLVLPGLTGVAEPLTAVAGLALGLTMVGAIIVHAKLKEAFTPALVLGVLSFFVGIGRVFVGF